MNLFDLYARIMLDKEEYERKIKEVLDSGRGLADGLKDSLGSAGRTVASGLAAGAGAAAAALGEMSRAAIESYADYEQLKGGVETLFDASKDVVLEYANNAFATAGMSANQYMETVTGFSAALLSSMDGDTAAAAEKADRAITDMADNANKMGSSLESIQNAYQGFSKQNYTMLDNLKLGYGGTKSEMQRLLADAERLSGKQYDLSSYADIVDAIHVVQGEMKISGRTADEVAEIYQNTGREVEEQIGTTAEEAGGTIQGSIGMLKASWANFLTGMSDGGQNFDVLVEAVLESVDAVGKNLSPRIQELLPRLSEGLLQLAQGLLPQLPAVLDGLLPALIEGTAGLLNSFVTLLPALIAAAVGALPQLTGAAGTILVSLFSALTEAAPMLLGAGVQLLDQLTAGVETGLPDLVARLPQIIAGFVDFFTENLPQIMTAGTDLLLALTEGLLGAIPELAAGLPKILGALLEFFATVVPTMLAKGAELLAAVLEGILGAIPQLVQKLPEVLTAVADALKAGWDRLKEVGAYLLEGMWAGITDKVAWLKEKVSGVVDTIKGWFTGSEGFDEHSPSKWAEKVGAYVAQGLANGIGDGARAVESEAEKLARAVYQDLAAWADRQIKFEKASLGDQLSIWRAIQSQFLSDSRQYAEAEEKIYALKAQIREDYGKKEQAVLQKNSDLEKNYQSTLAGRVREIVSSYALFDEVPERQKVSGLRLVQDLERQLAAMEGFYQDLRALEERGAGSALVEEIRAMGPGAADQLDALLALSDERLSQYAALYEEKQALANRVASEELESLRQETDQKLLENLSDLRALYDENAPVIGRAFTDGLAEGMMSGMSAVVDSAVFVAEASVSAVEERLGVHSPSTVFAEIGENMALGLAKGWEDRYGTVQGAVTRDLDFGSAHVDFAASGLGLSAAGVVNGLSGGTGPERTGPVTINLMTRDGQKLAAWFLPYLFDSARANGTPLLAPM